MVSLKTVPASHIALMNIAHTALVVCLTVAFLAWTELASFFFICLFQVKQIRFKLSRAKFPFKQSQKLLHIK